MTPAIYHSIIGVLVAALGMMILRELTRKDTDIIDLRNAVVELTVAIEGLKTWALSQFITRNDYDHQHERLEETSASALQEHKDNCF